MLDKKIFIRCLICVILWIVGQIIILNIHLNNPEMVSRVWGVICLIGAIILNVLIGFKKNDE